MANVAREMVRRCERILVPSEFVAAEVVLSLGAHPAKVTHTPLGCDHILRGLPPEGFGPASEPYVLSVSRVDPRKNHIRMLEAFEMLVREGFPHRWILAGPPAWGGEVFERALEASPARERVQWLRYVPESQLARLYAQADLVLFVSLSEGFGFPALESMACGTPVVASCVTSVPEVCGDAAFLVEPTDSERIFEAARRLLAEPDLAREMRERGLQQARKFTWKACAKATLLAYQNATSKGGAAPALRRSL
jgi:alpha-1,3-rhamnosyl/mannosyltransferase